MQNNIQSILALAKREPKTLEQMALKLAEETGEVAQAILSAGNSSGSVYKKLSMADAQEECVDVILVALALFEKLSAEDTATEATFSELLEKKTAKWEAHMGKDTR
ncbi:MazG-like family protein [Brochothrix thermosphacta]|uniref:MazG-like family protein n=1 Tax=Brochothrix thermosphacta TaxID=2756 RepID=UPI0039B0FF6C